MTITTDSRRDKLFALRMQIAIARRERDETLGRPFPDRAEVEEHDARIGQLQERYDAELWRGAP